MAFSIHRDYVFMAIQHIASRSSNKISTPSPLNHFQLRASLELFGFLLRVAIKSGSLQSWLILMLIKFMDVLVISRSKLPNIFYFRLRYFFSLHLRPECNKTNEISYHTRRKKIRGNSKRQTWGKHIKKYIYYASFSYKITIKQR